MPLFLYSLYWLKGVWHEIFEFGFFSMNQFPSGPWVFQWGSLQICTKIRGDIHNFVFTGVKDTGGKLSLATSDKLIAGNNVTGDN